LKDAGGPDRLTWPRRIGWASGDAGINFYWQGIGIFAYFFYTDVLGISPMWAGIAFATASFWDAVFDPLMGAIADRTRTRYGRFRPWILFASVPCGISFALMFWTPPLADGWLVAYAIGSHILFRTMLAAIAIPFSALTARLTQDSEERGTIAMLRLMFAASGALVVSLTVPNLVAVLGNENDAYFYAAIVLAVGATLILFISFLATSEPPNRPGEDQADDRTDLFRSFGSDLAGFWATLRHNGPLARLFAAVILSGITTAMNAKVLLYWIKYDLNDQSVMAWLLPLPAVILVLVAPIWTQIAKRWSKRAAWLAGTSLSIISLSSFYLLNPHDYQTLIPITVIGAAGGSAGLIMFWSMLPDTVEYNEWVRGDRSEAKIFGFATFGQKTAYAINAILLGQLLTAIGFVADKPQSPEILADLRAIMCLIPLGGVVGTILIMWRYPITAVFHAQLRADIAERGRYAVSA
jgi:GPH family glycoside/pentoside/hexuronide:cation symporter